MTRLNPEALRYAATVGENGSFTAAARSCDVSQPALSNAIAKLESTLGQQLFLRSSHGVSPTPFGEQILPMVERALTALDRVTAEAGRWNGTSPDVIRVGVSPLIDPALIAKVHGSVGRLGAEPRQRDLVLREANLTELRQALTSSDLDLMIAPSVGPIPRYEHRIIDSEPMVLVGSAPAASDPIELRDVADGELILVANTCGLTTFTRDLLASHNLPLRAYPGEALSYRVLEEWSALGLGSALLPLSRISGTTANARRVVEDGLEVEIFYEAVWNPNSALAEELRALSDLLVRS